MTVYDYYKLLGVGREATAEQVRAAFQRQAAKCHPSQRPDDEAAARRYRLLEAAYQVLSDPDQRAKYDRLIDRRAAGLDSPAKRPKAAKEASSKATPKARRVRPADKPSRQRVVIRPAPEEAARHKRFHRRRSKAERYALQALKHILWWSVSAAIHVAVLLILANWYLQEQSQEELFGKLPIVDIVPPKAKPEPLDLSTQKSPEPPTLEPTFEEPDLDEIIDKDAFAEVQRQAKAKVAAVEGPFGRRTPQGRARALEGGGATAGSEAAVNAGLLWLATHQQRTGGWQADREASYWVNPGITGLATLAFLGAGHTHRPGRYQEIVRRALAYLKRKQDTEGCIAYRQDGKRAGGYMYNHAIGTLALVEAYAMTKDATLREPAERAVDFISRTQNSTGGWRYYAHSPDADSSVSGWMVMALRSARLAGIIVPDKTFDGARKFFDSVTDREKGVTFYRVNGGRQIVSVASFAIGLLAHE
ncbi:MAG: DnaJ domain-containing protein, partial [Planctomycetota bacterium]